MRQGEASSGPLSVRTTLSVGSRSRLHPSPSCPSPLLGGAHTRRCLSLGEPAGPWLPDMDTGRDLDRTWRAGSWGDEIRPPTRGFAPTWHFTGAAELLTVDFPLDMSPSPRFPTREAYLGRGKGQLHSFAGQLPLRMTFQGPTPWATTSGRNPSALTLPVQQKGRANPHAFI